MRIETESPHSLKELHDRLMRVLRAISFGDGKNPENIDGVWLSFTSNVAANTEDAITHTLKRKPIGFATVKLDKAAIVYDSGTAWTTSTIYLKTSLASVAVTMFVF